jgi:excisionase family DNA binding protein
MSTTPITTAEAASRLGISRRRVLALIHDGRLSAVRFGRDWLIRPAGLAAVAERRPGRPKKVAGKS